MAHSDSINSVKRKPGNDGFEVSVHLCPPAFERELTHIFPDKNCENMVAVPTMQHALCDLVNIGEDVEYEKDRLLNEVHKHSWNSWIQVTIHIYLRHIVYDFCERHMSIAFRCRTLGRLHRPMFRTSGKLVT